MAPFAGTAFIPYHESWSYFARAFRLTIPTTIENKPGFAPSPSRVHEVIEIAKKEKVRAIVTEPYYDVSIAQLIATEAGVPCLNLTIDVGGTSEQKDYISMIDYVVNQFVKAFSGPWKPIIWFCGRNLTLGYHEGTWCSTNSILRSSAATSSA